MADETARHRWVIETAERTLDRLDAFDEAGNEYAQMARDRYGDMGSTYREAVITALEHLDEAETDATL